MIVLGEALVRCSFFWVFVFGIVALFGAKNMAAKGILGRAIAGICINGIIIFFMLIAIPVFIQAAHKAKEMQQQRYGIQPPQP